MNEEIYQNHGGAEKRKWVTVGGSYPGALSAWFKSKYPDHAVVGWSSSGVIHAIQDYDDYDFDIYNSTLKSGEDCPNTIKSLTEYVDGIFDDHEEGDKKDEYK